MLWSNGFIHEFLVITTALWYFKQPFKAFFIKTCQWKCQHIIKCTSRKIFCSQMNKIDSVTLSLGEDVSQFPTSFLRNATLIQSEYLFTFENTFIWNFYIISILMHFFWKITYNHFESKQAISPQEVYQLRSFRKIQYDSTLFL